MTKPFKSLNEQIQHLQLNKSVVFTDIEKAKGYLRDSNYFNVISCGKVKFAERIENGCHVYSPHSFEEWTAYFEQDCYVSEYLMLTMIEFERTLNSRVAFYVSQLFAENLVTANQRNNLLRKIKDSKVKNAQLFDGNEAWKFITKMTFGETKNLLTWLSKNKQDTFIEIVKDYPYLQQDSKKRLDYLNYLRNVLFHFTPLNIFLSYAYQRDGKINNRFHKSAVEFVYQLSPDKRVRAFLEDIFQSSDHFVAIKNGQDKP